MLSAIPGFYKLLMIKDCPYFRTVLLFLIAPHHVFIHDLGMSPENYTEIVCMIPVYQLTKSGIIVTNRIIIKLKYNIDIHKVIVFTYSQVNSKKASKSDDQRCFIRI